MEILQLPLPAGLTLHNRTLNCTAAPAVFKITLRYGPRRKHSLYFWLGVWGYSIVACVFVAAGMCLPSDEEWIMTWKCRGRKLSWLDLRQCPRVCLKGIRSPRETCTGYPVSGLRLKPGTSRLSGRNTIQSRMKFSSVYTLRSFLMLSVFLCHALLRKMGNKYGQF
jgi:hypothetical protein